MNTGLMQKDFQTGFTKNTGFQKRSRVLGLLIGSLCSSLFTTSALGVIGPAPDAPAFAPYVVMVLDSSDGVEEANYCTASILSPDTVLTAAHCVISPSSTHVFFQSGEQSPPPILTFWIGFILLAMVLALIAIRFWHIRSSIVLQAFLSLVLFASASAYYFFKAASAQLTFVEVTSIAIHPGYQPNSGGDTASIDLALLRLTKPLPQTFTPVQWHDPLPIKIGQRVELIGFGRADEIKGNRQKIPLSAVLAISHLISPMRMELIDPNGTGLGGCTGDSGAPIFTPDKPRLLAVAVSARGDHGLPCGGGTQAILIEPQLPWIGKVLAAWATAPSGEKEGI